MAVPDCATRIGQSTHLSPSMFTRVIGSAVALGLCLGGFGAAVVRAQPQSGLLLPPTERFPVQPVLPFVGSAGTLPGTSTMISGRDRRAMLRVESGVDGRVTLECECLEYVCPLSITVSYDGKRLATQHVKSPGAFAIELTLPHHARSTCAPGSQNSTRRPCNPRRAAERQVEREIYRECREDLARRPRRPFRAPSCSSSSSSAWERR